MGYTPKFFIDAYWAGEPSASGRDNDSLWYYDGKQNRVRKNDRVLLYETKGHPDRKELRGSGKVFQSATVVTDLIKLENLTKVGGKSWDFRMQLRIDVRVERNAGIGWEKVRQVLGYKPGATLRNPPLEIKESQFYQIESELKRMPGCIQRTPDIPMDERDEAIDELQDKWFMEGGKSIRTHLAYERNRNLVIEAKKELIGKYGRLMCNICGMSLEEIYGDIGKNVMDMHHITPVSEIDEKGPVKTSHLIPICPNCHRIIHSTRPFLSVDDVRSNLKR
jgi:hypothetical protein